MFHIFVLLCILSSSQAFPNGAPVDACVKSTPNRPFHGTAQPQPLQTNPYTVLASGHEYQPGTVITVTIEGHVFKGFFIQARDARTDDWLGEFVQSENTKSLPECSSITHADSKNKLQATLIWRAPARGVGSVYFTGTVLQDYGTYWSELVAAVVPGKR